MVSGTISLPCSGCFSPFPHGTGSLSVSREYLALPDGPGGFTQDSSCPALLRIPLRCVVLQPQPCRNKDGLGFSPVARHYWGNHSYFLFLRVLRCFSSPRWPPTSYWMSSLQDDGLSHSEIRGSKAICAYPQLFAAYHVLHRLREPRHPPCALSYFPARPTLKTGARLFLTASRYPPLEGDMRGARLSLSSNMS